MENTDVLLHPSITGETVASISQTASVLLLPWSQGPTCYCWAASHLAPWSQWPLSIPVLIQQSPRTFVNGEEIAVEVNKNI